MNSYFDILKAAVETPLHRFSLRLAGADALSERNFDRLYEAGCDDALFGCYADVQIAHFARRAPTLHGAVESAIQQVQSAVRGLRVTHVEIARPDDAPFAYRGLHAAVTLSRTIFTAALHLAPGPMRMEPQPGLRTIAATLAPDRAYEQYEMSLNECLDAAQRKNAPAPLTRVPAI